MATGLVGHAVRHRAEDPSFPLHPLAPDDDEIGADVVGHPDDHVRRVPTSVWISTSRPSAPPGMLSSTPGSLPQERVLDGSETLAPPEGTETAAEVWAPAHQVETGAVLSGQLCGQGHRLTGCRRAVGPDHDG